MIRHHNWVVEVRRFTHLLAGVALLCALASVSQHPLQISVDSSSHAVSLAWDAVPSAQTYQVTARKGNGHGEVVTDQSTSNTHFTINGLSPNTEIVVTVAAIGDFKSEVSTTKAVQTTNTDVGIPKNLRTLAVEGTWIEIGWSAVESATGYVAKIRSLQPTSTDQILAFDELEVDRHHRSIRFEGLVPNQVYTVHLSARDQEGVGRPTVLPVKTLDTPLAELAPKMLANSSDSEIKEHANRLVVKNMPPKLNATATEFRLTPENPNVELNLDGFFKDPENGPLVYTAYSLDPEIVATTGEDSLALNAVAQGRATVHLIATDVHGESTSQFLSVAVDGEKFHAPQEPFTVSQRFAQQTNGTLTNALPQSSKPLVIFSRASSSHNRGVRVASGQESLANERRSSDRLDRSNRDDIHFISYAELGESSVSGDLALLQHNVRGRSPVKQLGSIGFAVHSDYASASYVSTDANTAPLRRQISQLRAGLEGSFTTPIGNLGSLTPFTGVNLRQDSGIRDHGTGVELAGGLRLSNDRISLEAQGRALAMHSVDSVRENKFSLRASLNASQDGSGLSLAVEPSWGRLTTLQTTPVQQDSRFLARRLTPYTPQPTEIDIFNVNTRIGYGMKVADNRFLLTPFVDADLSDVYERTRLLGMRLDRIRDMKTPFSLDMSVGVAERESQDTGVANMRFSISF